MKLVLLVPLFTGENIEAREVSWTPKNTWLGSGGRSDSQTKDLDHNTTLPLGAVGEEEDPTA